MSKVVKKLNQTTIKVRNSNGKIVEHTVPLGTKIRKIKKYVFDLTEGNGSYISSDTKELTYEMELEEFLKHAKLTSVEESEEDSKQLIETTQEGEGE